MQVVSLSEALIEGDKNESNPVVDMDITQDGRHPELDLSKEKSSWRRRR